MAETKRVSDQYTIISPAIVLDGNLTILGSTTTLDTTNSIIKDNIITLNEGESGAGVTAGTSGLDIDRGSLNNATLLFNETGDAWEARIGGSYAVVRGATPAASNDLTTKAYVDTSVSALSPGTPFSSIQFNNAGVFAGSPNLVWNGAELQVQNLVLSFNVVRNTSLGDDLELSTNNGQVYFKDVLRIDNQVSDPTPTAGANMIYAKIPSGGGSGVFFSNSTASGELISKSKAIIYGLIF